MAEHRALRIGLIAAGLAAGAAMIGAICGYLGDRQPVVYVISGWLGLALTLVGALLFGVQRRLLAWPTLAWVVASFVSSQVAVFALVSASDLSGAIRAQTSSIVSGVYILQAALGVALVVLFRLAVITIDRLAPE